MSDMHVHTKHSIDSNAKLESYCIAAIDKGIKNICFTEHVDWNPNDDGYLYYNSEAFFRDFKAVKVKYSAEINLLCGLEFSEPHLYSDELMKMQDIPYDLIIGSVHYWLDDMFPSEMVKAGIPVEACYESYWDAVLSCVQTSGFDVLGHIDFPKRYYKKLLYNEDKIREICTTMIKNDIILEINTSSLLKGIDETMPGEGILSIYRDCGGQYVTLGSDAHSSDFLGYGYTTAKDLADRFGLIEVIFINRERIIL